MIKNVIKFTKGLLIGGGAILPGVSGGALAAIFGIYEPLLSFISNPRINFKKNIRYFAPIFAGMLVGGVLLSYALSYFLAHNLTEISLFFVGCMFGIFPSLVKQAGLHGRKPIHVVLLILTALISFLLLTGASTDNKIQFTQNITTWLIAGAIIGLGLVLPGLSTANFLMYMDLYEPMHNGISNLNFAILIPLAIGALSIFILLSKLVKHLLNIAYPTVFHIIVGLVLTSTVMIFPFDANFTWVNSISLAFGLILGQLMTKFEKLKN